MKQLTIKQWLRRLTLMLGVAVLSASAASAGGVVATIPPLHSIVQAVMGDSGEATLLLPGAGSVHGVALKPSQVRALYDADIVFYVHEELDTFLPPVVREGAHAHAAAAFIGVHLLPFRRGTEDAHDDHATDDDHDAHDDHATDDDHDAHDDHQHGAYDLHFWLDIDNAKAVAQQVAQVLSARAPQHAETYAKNSAAFQQRLSALDKELAQVFAPVTGVPYVVFHDAYQYVERRYGLQPPTPLHAQPHFPSSARRLSAVKQAIAVQGIRCAFSEPQFSDKSIRVVAGDALHLGVLDPLGSKLLPGEGLYFALLRNLAQEMATCLAAQ